MAAANTDAVVVSSALAARISVAQPEAFPLWLVASGSAPDATIITAVSEPHAQRLCPDAADAEAAVDAVLAAVFGVVQRGLQDDSVAPAVVRACVIATPDDAQGAHLLLRGREWAGDPSVAVQTVLACSVLGAVTAATLGKDAAALKAMAWIPSQSPAEGGCSPFTHWAAPEVLRIAAALATTKLTSANANECAGGGSGDVVPERFRRTLTASDRCGGGCCIAPLLLAEPSGGRTSPSAGAPQARGAFSSAMVQVCGAQAAMAPRWALVQPPAICNGSWPVAAPVDDEPRRLLHDALLLPKDVPQLRLALHVAAPIDSSNASGISAHSSPIRQLVPDPSRDPLARYPALPPHAAFSPHAADPADGTPVPLPKGLEIARGTTHFVRQVGAVPYMHYRIDAATPGAAERGLPDDSGWGCAYRALQAALGWAALSGYVPGCGAKPDSLRLPTLPDIQSILRAVDPAKAGPKHADFVGSREWIGSFESMVVLQHFSPGLQCRVQRVDEGLQLAEDAAIHRALAGHFDRGGGPVVIGGAQLAYTIVGIHTNVRLGEARYLVLDPHYTGDTRRTGMTDVAVALKKGWVGWKDPSVFFKRTAWYNLCMPAPYETDWR